jgi:hypothetical protein
MLNLLVYQIAQKNKTRITSWYKLENMYNCEYSGSIIVPGKPFGGKRWNR